MVLHQHLSSAQQLLHLAHTQAQQMLALAYEQAQQLLVLAKRQQFSPPPLMSVCKVHHRPAHLHPAPESSTTKARLPVKNSMLSFLKSHGILKTLQPMLTPKPISAPTTQKEPIPIALRRLKLRRFPSARSQSFPDPSNVPLVLPAPFRKSFLDPSNVLLDQLTLFP